VVDDNLVATVGTQRGLHGLGDGAAGIDVAKDGAILGVVAGRCFSYVFRTWCVLEGEQ
jgi:hypothetical protein